MIDIDPGYQKLCGKDALAYVRYRHGDNDLVRAARQQDFLRQVRRAKGTRKLIGGGIGLGNLKKLAHVFARYFDRDKSLDDKKEVFKFAKTVLFTARNPVREVRFRVVDAPDHVNLVASQSMLEESVDEFLNAKASAKPREPDRADQGRSAGVAGARASASATSRRRSRASRRRAPRARTRRSSARARSTSRSTSRRCGRAPRRYQGTEPRTYTIRDEIGKQARRLPAGAREGRRRRVLRRPGHELARRRRSSTTRTRRSCATAASSSSTATASASGSSPGGRRKAVYWVPNTLTQSLSAQQMIAIAASLKRLGGRYSLDRRHERNEESRSA